MKVSQKQIYCYFYIYLLAKAFTMPIQKDINLMNYPVGIDLCHFNSFKFLPFINSCLYLIVGFIAKVGH